MTVNCDYTFRRVFITYLQHITEMIAETVFFVARFANYSNGDRAAGRKLAINLQLYPSCHTTLQSDDVDVLLARPLL